MKLHPPLFMALLAGLTILPTALGCRKQGETLPENPPVPVAQPMVLEGLVLDRTTGLPVAGANLAVVRPDDSILGTVVSDAKGVYRLSVADEPGTQLHVWGRATGYGVARAFAELDHEQNRTSVPVLMLRKMQESMQTIGSDGGVLNASPCSESLGGGSLRLTVPTGTFAGPTSLTLAPAPVSDVPIPALASVQTVGAVAINAGTALFGKPAEATIPLPFTGQSGQEFLAYRLNPATSRWEALSERATVDPTGRAVRLPILASGTYTFTEEVLLDPHASAPAASGITESPAAPAQPSAETRTLMVSLTSGTKTISLEHRIALAFLVRDGSIPTDDWVRNVLIQRLGIDPLNTKVDWYLAYPKLPGKYQRDGRQYNPDRPQELGRWEYRWYFETYDPASGYVNYTKPHVFKVTVKVDQFGCWRLTGQTGWYWQTITGATGATGGSGI